MVQILLGIWFVVVIGLIIFKVAKSEGQTGIDLSHDDLIRYKTLDEVRKKCREISESGEVTYFSLEDIDKIVDGLKEKNE